jgi:hypothetical protein
MAMYWRISDIDIMAKTASAEKRQVIQSGDCSRKDLQRATQVTEIKRLRV